MKMNSKTKERIGKLRKTTKLQKGHEIALVFPYTTSTKIIRNDLLPQGL